MYQTIHEYLRYTLTMKLFVHNMIRIAYRTTLKTVYVYIYIYKKVEFTKVYKFCQDAIIANQLFMDIRLVQ